MTAPIDNGLRNFVYAPYKPLASPLGKLRSSAIASSAAERNPRLLELIQRLRALLGVDRVVYGIKKNGRRLFWEFYFYDNADKRINMAQVKRSLAPEWKVRADPPDDTSGLMFSIEVDAKSLKTRVIDGFDYYRSIPLSGYIASHSYHLGPAGVTRKNSYLFFDCAKRYEEAGLVLKDDLHGCGAQPDIDQLLMPALKPRNCVCLSRKRVSEAARPRFNGLYLSGIDVKQLLFFLEFFQYPAAIRDFVGRNKSRLDHLQYDVGFDYEVERDLLYTKSSFYGIL